MSEKRENGLSGFLKVGAGVIVGLATGVAAGLLIAPKKGSETLEELKEITLKFKDDTEDKLNDLKEYGEEKISEVKEFGEEAFSTIKNKSEELLEQENSAGKAFGKNDLPIDISKPITEVVKKATDATHDVQTHLMDIPEIVENVVDTVSSATPATDEMLSKVAESSDILAKKTATIEAADSEVTPVTEVTDHSTESLLARIQGVTADSLEKE